MGKLSPDETQFLKEAARFLEHPSLLMRIANYIGKPVEMIEKRLPQSARDLISVTTQKSLQQALEIAVRTIGDERATIDFRAGQQRTTLRNRLHTLCTAITGGIGGFFGVVSLPIELPVTTGLMLRSIAEAAKVSGADLKSAETRLECLYVFTLGTSSPSDDAAETGYYASRLGLAQIISHAAAFVSTHTAREVLSAIEKGSAPILVQFISRIASKFEIAVSEKVLSEAIPIVGAAGGALVNSAFTHFFSEAARFHFGIRRLERIYGTQEIQRLYKSLKD